MGRHFRRISDWTIVYLSNFAWRNLSGYFEKCYKSSNSTEAVKNYFDRNGNSLLDDAVVQLQQDEAFPHYVLRERQWLYHVFPDR